MIKLPKDFRAVARKLAETNKAYTSVKDAEKLLAGVLGQLRSDGRTESITTGGFMMRKDGEGCIEIWINPSVAWSDDVKQNWTEQ